MHLGASINVTWARGLQPTGEVSAALVRSVDFLLVNRRQVGKVLRESSNEEGRDFRSAERRNKSLMLPS